MLLYMTYPLNRAQLVTKGVYILDGHICTYKLLCCIINKHANITQYSGTANSVFSVILTPVVFLWFSHSLYILSVIVYLTT